MISVSLSETFNLRQQYSQTSSFVTSIHLFPNPLPDVQRCEMLPFLVILFRKVTHLKITYVCRQNFSGEIFFELQLYELSMGIRQSRIPRWDGKTDLTQVIALKNVLPLILVRLKWTWRIHQDCCFKCNWFGKPCLCCEASYVGHAVLEIQSRNRHTVTVRHVSHHVIQRCTKRRDDSRVM